LQAWRWAQGQGARAIQLWGAAESTRVTLGFVLLPTEQERYDRDLAAVHATLAEEAFDIAWRTGQAMSLEQAVAYALEAEIG
jgi:hypothetical protein